jgi:hypothetical protein
MSDEKDLCILINGATRVTIDSIKECIENYKTLFPGLTFDVWLHTWKTEEGQENLLKDYVDFFIADRKPFTQEELDSLGVPFVQQLINHPQHKICRISHYSTYQAFCTLFKAIEEKKKKYKYALRARNDLFIKINTSEWINKISIVENENLYITVPNLWCVGAGANDHFGFGNFELVKKIWTPSLEIFNQTLSKSHNFEYAVGSFIQMTGCQQLICEPEKYIIRRLGRKDHNFTVDWELK